MDHLHKTHIIIIFAENEASMSLTLSLHHIVVNTFSRNETINPLHREDLYRYIWSLVEARKCRLLRIGGVENHIHLLVDVHPSVAVADLVGELKRKSSLWMKKSGFFPAFEGWGKEYFAFSKSQKDKSVIIEYIKRQPEHHGRHTLEEELKEMAHSEGAEWNDAFLT